VLVVTFYRLVCLITEFARLKLQKTKCPVPLGCAIVGAKQKRLTYQSVLLSDTTRADMIKNQKKTAINRLGQCGRILSQQFMPPVFSLAILLLFTSAALAQLTTADILGTVTDPTGASSRMPALPSPTSEPTTSAPSSPMALATTPSPSFPSDITLSRLKPPVSRSR
jgi:hypothetical protein